MPVKLTNSASVIIVNVSRRLSYALFFSLFILSFSVASGVEEDSCTLQTPNHRVSVRFVNDGDTLTLHDDKRIRIIGINAPEVGYKDRPDQPLAVQARERLRAYLHNNNAFIVHDADRYDKYGRVLAHVFDEQGNNVGAKLIREGLGFAISIPPNLRYRDCYRNAERHARRTRQGVWAEPYFTPTAADKLKYSGFNRVSGCIQRVRKYRDKKYLYLSDRFRFLIPQQNEIYFETETSSVIFEKGLCLIVTGWVYNQHPYRTMKLLHPDSAYIYTPNI